MNAHHALSVTLYCSGPLYVAFEMYFKVSVARVIVIGVFYHDVAALFFKGRMP
jgi:hypothetical protein